MSLDKIIEVSISRLTKFPTKVGFGRPLILDINVKQSAGDIDTVSDIAAVEALGFVTADEAHRAASAHFAQNPHSPDILIARREINVAQVDTVVIGGADDGTYTISINGVDFSFVASSSTIELIRDALVTAINAGGEPVTAAPVSTDTITITADVSGTGFATILISNPSDNMVLTLTTPNTGIGGEISRVNGINSDWYFLHSTSRTEQDILAAAAKIETLIKIYAFDTDDADSKDLAPGSDTTSILAQLKLLSLMRTFGVWTKTSNLDNYPSIAWVAKNAPEEGGSVNWKFVQVASVLADDELTDTEIANIEGKNGNLYTTTGGLKIFSEGIMSDKEFIDNVRGTDQLSARIQESVFALLTQVKKVPMTDGGVQTVVIAIKEPLQEAEDNLFLSPDPKFLVIAPLVSEIPVADRAARFLKEIEFEATLAGAVNKVRIVGRLTV